MFTEMMKRLSRKSRQAGFTVAEATIVISAAAILAGSATPVISGYVETARLARAKADLQVLGSSIQMYRLDTATHGFIQKGKVQSVKKDQSTSARVMVSNGDVPQVGPGGEPEWMAPFDGQTVDFFQDFSAGKVDATLYPLSQSGGTFLFKAKAGSAAVSSTNPMYSMTARVFSYAPISGDVGAASTTSVQFRNGGAAGLTRATTGVI